MTERTELWHCQRGAIHHHTTIARHAIDTGNRITQSIPFRIGGTHLPQTHRTTGTVDQAGTAGGENGCGRGIAHLRHLHCRGGGFRSHQAG